MTYVIDFLNNQALGFFIGFPLGFFVAAGVIRMVRCDNCCMFGKDGE